MLEGRRIRTRTPEWRAVYHRIQVAMELTSRLNVLPFSDIEPQRALLSELLGKPFPETAIVHPPFYSTYGLGIELGDRTFVGQACSFLDLGGITIGDRAMIAQKVTLITEGTLSGPPSAMSSSLWHRSSSKRTSGLVQRPPSCLG
ncbi:MAG: hypothetical protein QOE89_3535 [Pseudonocardiales bacterium]|nr:hypothetical protein [Pseudonocardiales bacterium]